MLKKTVTFEDFNGKQCSEDLYFHVSKAAMLTAPDQTYNEIMEIGKALQSRGEELQLLDDVVIDELDPFDEKSQMLAEGIRMVARLLDRLVDLAYGKKSEDGTRFIKNEKVLQEFKESAAYDAFVEELIMNHEEMLGFINQLVGK